jgi:hypothetical protein
MTAAKPFKCSAAAVVPPSGPTIIDVTPGVFDQQIFVTFDQDVNLLANDPTKFQLDGVPAESAYTTLPTVLVVVRDSADWPWPPDGLPWTADADLVTDSLPGSGVVA